MPKRVPNKKAEQIKALVRQRADAAGYITSNRTENTQFLDSLVADETIGGVLREYLPKDRVRTYIKDGILNAYAKQSFNSALEAVTPVATIQKKYGVAAEIIFQGKDKEARLSISRSEDGRIFVVSGGTVLKWETALRKALDIIAQKPTLIIDGKTPSICISLVDTNNSLTEADKNHISIALAAVKVQVAFCND